ncbi:MAG: DUF393 domain-containing protein [Bacteriovoracaceae bacterium]|nr:DUF393 domain-containing protein [Bacteriovoracaceae bacterium]
MSKKETILFFDGVCTLCNGFVDFSLNYSKDNIVKFASLQGETAKELLSKENISDLDTVYLYDDGKLYSRSEAIARLAAHLSFPWNLIVWIKVFPLPVRDFGYKLVAKNRYKLFGKKDTCRYPTESERQQLLP